MREWVTQEDKRRKKEAKGRMDSCQDSREGSNARRVRCSQDEDKGREVGEREASDSKRKEETAKEESPDTKRRRTQDEEDEEDDLLKLW
eukprot:8566261-Karenia_brevis.AAC.1